MGEQIKIKYKERKNRIFKICLLTKWLRYVIQVIAKIFENEQNPTGKKFRLLVTKMVIEINKDIEKYQESVVMGLTAKQLLFSILSLLSGGLSVLLAYQRFGLTISCYLAVPVAAPIALGGFYQYNDMDFYEMLRRYLQSLFYHKVLLYIATEYKDEMEERKAEHLAGHQNDRKVKRRKRLNTRKAHKG